MKIGKLDRRITIERRSGGLDAYGQPADSWEPVATVWASIQPVTTKAIPEAMQAMQLVGMVRHTVLVRYRADLAAPSLTDGWRIVHSGRVFNILSSMTLDEGRRWIRFNCEEGTVSGD